MTLAEAPIQNFTMENVTWSGPGTKKGAYQCTGLNGTKAVTGLFATGKATNVYPPLPSSCTLAPLD